MRNKVDNSTFNNSWFDAGRSKMVVLIWYFVNAVFFKSFLLPISSIKRVILRVFGAKVGDNVIIKPNVNIKYPWKLEIGKNTWIGESVWIDNLAKVSIGKNVCISQGAMLLCGNHNFKKSTFDLMIGVIDLRDGVWIGAKSIVCPGVTCFSHSILTINSIANRDLDQYKIYRGNPAKEIGIRQIQ